ncbi:MAG: HAD hydrolase family protein [Desulfamplus sp.]|nr:HAD hydrolase family protein [Desulfamplus sp.]
MKIHSDFHGLGWSDSDYESLIINALVCDLDGTLLHSEQEAIPVQGRTRASFLSKNAALLLGKISQIFPVVIATGRNGNSVYKLVSQLPDVQFKGFVFENGFVAKHKIGDNQITAYDWIPVTPNNENQQCIFMVKVAIWNKIAALFPDWERLPYYENSVGFVFPFDKKDIDSGAMDRVAGHAEKILKENGYNYCVHKETKKLFIYPGHVDKMKGLALLRVHPYIAMGDESNDLQMMQQSNFPITLNSCASEVKDLIKQKNGFCSMQTSHNAACEMLEFAYEKIKNIV